MIQFLGVEILDHFTENCVLYGKSDRGRGGRVEADSVWERSRRPYPSWGGPAELSPLPTPMQEMNDSWFTGLKIVGVTSVPRVGRVGRANTCLHSPPRPPAMSASSCCAAQRGLHGRVWGGRPLPSPAWVPRSLGLSACQQISSCPHRPQWDLCPCLTVAQTASAEGPLNTHGVTVPYQLSMLKFPQETGPARYIHASNENI